MGNLCAGMARATTAWSIFFICSVGFVPDGRAQQPSFNCSTSTASDERTICASTALSQLDRQMSDLYSAVLSRLDAIAQATLREAQRSWLRERAACATNASCITALYQTRISQLRGMLANAQPRPPGPAAPGEPSEETSHTFQLQMCTKGSRNVADVYLAIAAAASPDGQSIEVQGWWKIPANGCVNLGEFQRPGIFAYAMARNGQVFWSNPEPQLCVNLNSKFSYTFNADASRQCASQEEAKGFFGISIDDKSKSKKFTLNWQ